MGFTMAKSCEYCQIDGGYGKLIKETPYWMIFLAPSQRYLGTCVVALKRQCQDLSELEDEEWEDFIGILQKLEHSLKKTFNPTLFNWSCFKNKAFRDGDPNPEIHWHFHPRYQEKVQFSGLEFEDPDFGYVPKTTPYKVPEEIMLKIISAIQENL